MRDTERMRLTELAIMAGAVVLAVVIPDALGLPWWVPFLTTPIMAIASRGVWAWVHRPKARNS